jgi:hypothetical protein
MIRRIYPELIFNKIGATQTMDGPVSQIFYMGNSRGGKNGAGTYEQQTMYSMYKITPRGFVTNPIGSTSAAGVWGTAANEYASALTGDRVASNGFELSNVLTSAYGSPSTTMGGKLASWPNSTTTLGWSVSAAERLRASAIPEVTMHIQKQTVQAGERKMRALWTLEAAQDLKAYHNLDMEAELTELLSKEMNLEIDRELIEDVRMIAYNVTSDNFGGWYLQSLYNGNADSFGEKGGKGPDGGTFTGGKYQWDFTGDLAGLATEQDSLPNTRGSNVYVMDIARFINNSTSLAPQHLGHIYSNILALVNFASTDIYRTTLRGPGTTLITSPVIASMLESAAKLEGGLPTNMGPTNVGAKDISYVGKLFGKYDLIVDPMFPEDEIIVAYKGSGPMDAGFFYCPYIPIMSLPTVTDPETFQPRKGILTRYGKVAIHPASRFFRVIRLIGTGSDFLTKEIFRETVSGGLY